MHKQLILEALKQLYDLDLPNPNAGICTNLNNALKYKGIDIDQRNDMLDIIEAHFPSWRYYSGTDKFPIPSSNPDFAPGEYYAYRANKLWEGEQLLYRLDLLDHLIKKLEQELKA